MRSIFLTFCSVFGAVSVLSAGAPITPLWGLLGALNITLALYWAQPKVAK